MFTLPITPPETPKLIAGLSSWAQSCGSRWDPVAGAAAGVVCLDSALHGDGLGRWTIGAACPLATLRDDTDPFSAAGELLATRREPDATDLPFCGGLIGLWGYGSRAAVEPGCWDATHHGEPHAWWGFYDTFVAVDQVTRRAWVASWGLRHPDATPDGELAQARARALADHLRAAIPSPSGLQVAPLRTAMDATAHAGMISAILEDIAAGEYYQACATYPLRGPRGGASALDVFLTLRERTPAPFAAFLAPGGPMALAGASPERFLDLRQGRVRARPMKGTRPRGATPAEDLILRADLRKSLKDRAENVMIVDLMRNDLGRVCRVGSVRVPALYTVESYATVHQLTSTVVGELRRDVAPWELARACFPPGSMTGAPKIRAMERLAELEPGPRGWYSGALGYLDVRGEMDLSVVIRSALVSDEEIRWHVGGGIVADSTAAGEWAESLDKCPAWLRQRKVSTT